MSNIQRPDIYREGVGTVNLLVKVQVLVGLDTSCVPDLE